MSDTRPGEELTHYVKRVTRWTVLIALGVIAVALLWQQGDMAIPWGVLLGSFFGILKFRLRARNLLRFARAAEGQGRRVLMQGRAVSYLLAAVAIALAFACDRVNTWAVVLSLFLVNVIVIFTASQPPTPSGDS